jgi:hypothetical protein
MELLSLKMQMTDINLTAMIVATGTEIVMAAEIGTEIESEEIGVVTSHAERLMGIRNWLAPPPVNKGVLMGVLRVDAEVEAEMMTDDPHAGAETALTKQAEEMATSTEGVVVYAHDLEALETTIALEGTAAIAMMLMQSLEKIAEIEMIAADRVEVPRERILLHWQKMNEIVALCLFNNWLLVSGLKNS